MNIFFGDLTEQRTLGGKVVAGCSGLICIAITAAGLLFGANFVVIGAAWLLGAANAVLALSAGRQGFARMGQAVTLMAQVSVLVAAFAGRPWQPDMHMAYFAALGVLAIFADWTVILVAAATVALHHLTLSFLLPNLVFYNGGGGFGRVLLHAVILIAEAAVLTWCAANNVIMIDRIHASLSDASKAALDARQAQADHAAAVEAEARSREAAEHERFERAAQLAQVVKELARGLGALAEGVLTCRLVQPFAEEYEPLRRDFNASVEKLEGTVGQVVAAAQAINSGAGHITQAADNMSRRTEKQASSLQETAAALDEITATVKRTAEGAQHAHSVVAKASNDAQASGVVVEGAVHAMSAIERSSSQINQIIGVIDEIAFQTNLLALNAGVEAARAGEVGRGFAVVAQEVRALAQRSANAAKEIKGLITTSAKEVEGGVQMVGEAGKALRRIAEQVAGINAVVEDISHSTQEQAIGLSQVNSAVNQMDQITQQNAAMVEESTAASHNLANEAKTLDSLTRAFTVGASSPRTPPVRKSPNPVHAAQRRVASFAQS